MIFGIRAGKFVMKAGKFVNCACCGHTSPCNAGSIPDTLDFTINYGAFSLPVTLAWSTTACSGATEGWEWDGPDTQICPGFNLRAVNLCCSGTSWGLTVVVVNNGIQDDLLSGGTLGPVVTVDPSPMHLTCDSGGQYETPCGLEFILIDIQAS